MMIRTLVPLLLLASVWSVPVEEAHSKVVPLHERGSRIYNGQKAILGQFPWQAGLYLSAGGFTWFCGGSIISQEWILTAGSCVVEAHTITVIAGSLTVNDPNRITSVTNQSIVHEHFDRSTFQNNIGLVKLTEPLTFSNNIQKIALSNVVLGSEVPVTASGWGRTSDDASTISNDLYFVDLITTSFKECNGYYGTITDQQVCATYNRDVIQGICYGDSGGPLIVMDAESNAVQVGIVSFISIDGCETEAPSGYTRVAYFREWINDHAHV